MNSKTSKIRKLYGIVSALSTASAVVTTSMPTYGADYGKADQASSQGLPDFVQGTPQDLDANTRPAPKPVRPGTIPIPQPTLVGAAIAQESGYGTSTFIDAQGEPLYDEATGRMYNEVIVHYRNTEAFARDALSPTSTTATWQVLDENADQDSKLFRVPNAEEALTTLKKDPNVLFAEQNVVAKAAFDPNDTYYPSQWHLKDWGTTKGIGLRSAWNITTGNRTGRIVIVDTGMEANHPDLAGKSPLGYNFVNNNSSWSDCHGHGTNVAGTAAAVSNNQSGVAGADMNALIYVARISTDCAGSLATAYTAARAISNASAWSGAKVINLSYAFPYTAELEAAVQTARSRNVVVVAAAGNDNSNVRAYPAASVGALGVGATDQSGRRAAFSNWGSPNVDVSAPGVAIWTTARGGTYRSVQGTSFSSPLVAGVAMLVRSRYPNDSEGTIRWRIQAVAYNPERNCWNCISNNFGYGIVQAYYAVR